MNKVEMFVSLLIPDTTAITAANTLRKLGFEFETLKRADYYSFELEQGTDIEKFLRKITKVDILVNANKHKATFSRNSDDQDNNNKKGIVVTITDDNCSGLLDTLKNRLGLSEIKSMKKGTYWSVGESEESKIKKMAEQLLYNPNFQEYKVI